MSTRTETRQQVVIRNNNSTQVWEKNSAGCTTKGGYSSYNHTTGRTTDYYGRIKK